MSDNLFPQLSSEIGQLGHLCGAVVSQMTGEENLALVEQLRLLVRKLHQGDAAAPGEIRQLLAGLNERQIGVVTRGFTIFLELSNLAEDRQRVRVLRARERSAHPEAAPETVGSAIAAFHRQGIAAQDVQQYVNRLRIELVLTAHPTEAKRRSVRCQLGEIRELLAEADAIDVLPAEQAELDTRLATLLSKLWQTDFIRPWRPTVMQEVERGLRIKDVLWKEVPRVIRDLRIALAKHYPEVQLPNRPLIQYGSWIGGDRDGNPFVTPAVTEQTITYLREQALHSHLGCCQRLIHLLSLSERQRPAAACLVDAIAAAGQRWPQIEEQLAQLPPLETYRRWLFVVQWRLTETARATQAAEQTPGAYATASQLAEDVGVLAKSLVETGNQQLVEIDVQPWLDQIQAFGLHLARLDIRQDSGVYRAVIDEILSRSRLVPDIAELDEPARRRALVETMGTTLDLGKGDWDQGSPAAEETLELFTLLRRIARSYGCTAIGEHILSMTRVPSDLLTIMWFWRWSEQVDGGDPRDRELRLPIVPLFETIQDLQQAPDTMRALLAEPTYREYLSEQGDEQVVMIGYSDSAKDGGFLAAQWALQSSQARLMEVAKSLGVKLTFFHGRGGSLARGGGPAAQGVLSLPKSAFSGALRITEQGEVLADRYDNPAIAHRHLEQLMWSVLTAVSRDDQQPPREWTTAVGELAQLSLHAYRQLVDHPSFADFYRAVTPINAIEQLPIGSRPSKRKAGNRVEDLRAIPWVYSWTQCRAMLPAWYGLGSALESYLAEDSEARLALLQTMYAEWPFFQISIDSAALALAQANMPVFRGYAELSAQVAGSPALAEAVVDEHERTRQAVLPVMGCRRLIERTAWLERSIQVRNGYVDPLNLLQQELLRRAAASGSTEELEHLTHLTIKGISTGMRTTG
jgi:phosphoenolpyruvate carboxylase